MRLDAGVAQEHGLGAVIRRPDPPDEIDADAEPREPDRLRRGRAAGALHDPRPPVRSDRDRALQHRSDVDHDVADHENAGEGVQDLPSPSSRGGAGALWGGATIESSTKRERPIPKPPP